MYIGLFFEMRYCVFFVIKKFHIQKKSKKRKNKFKIFT